MEGANPNRKIKKVAGRTANPDAANQYEEEKQSKPKRVTFEEEAPLSVKQKKNENTKSKRQNEIEQYNTMNAEENHEELNYEDDFDDEWEDEEEIYIDKKGKKVSKQMADEEEEEEGMDEDELTRQFGELKFSDRPVIYEENDKNQKKKNKKTDEVKAFLGTTKNLKEDEVLEFDNTAYDLFHRSQTDWPCLSLDILCPDHNQGQLVKPHKVDIKEYPLTVYVVAGTQAPKQSDNSIYYMKWTHLHKTRYDDDSQVLDEEDLDNDAEAALDILPIKHNHSINRIRAMNNSSIVALWDESGSVSIYDGTKHTQVLVEHDEELAELEEEETGKKKEALKAPKDKNNFLLSQFQHSSEGYALTWSPHVLGMFATGSCDRKVHLYKLADANGSSWIMDETPFMVHKESVEDLQFSPSDPNILASCSVDGTIKFIDLRSDSRKKAEATIQVSNVDVNVISWSHASPNLIASGTEDGGVQVWDIRKITKGRSIADIKFHTDQITSIEFQPYEDSIVTVASADNRISVWDFSVEPDVKNKDADIPDQLMFVHQGLEDVKEVRHHPYMSDLILSTAANGFNIFKPNYEEVHDDEEDEM